MEHLPLGHQVPQPPLADRRPTDDVAAVRDIVTDLARLPDANRHLTGMVSGLDVRYPMPGGGNHPLLGARMPDIDLMIDGVATQLSTLMHAGRGLLVDLTGDDHFRDVLTGHDSVIDICRATTATNVDVTAVLLRPDGHICWLRSAAHRGEPSTSLRAATEHWFEPGVTDHRASSSP